MHFLNKAKVSDLMDTGCSCGWARQDAENVLSFRPGTPAKTPQAHQRVWDERLGSPAQAPYALPHV